MTDLEWTTLMAKLDAGRERYSRLAREEAAEWRALGFENAARLCEHNARTLAQLHNSVRADRAAGLI